MKFKRFMGLALSLVIMFSSLNVALASETSDETPDKLQEILEQKAEALVDDDVLSDSAVEVDEEIVAENEAVAFAAADTAYFAYAVEGGNIYYDPNTGTVKSADVGITSVTIPPEIDGVKITGIGSYAFKNCVVLTNVNIPNSITSIGNSAFYGCTALTSVNIPNSVSDIRYDAFNGCKNLKSVIFNENTTNGFKMSIGERAFYGCTSLTSLELPHQVTSLGYEMIGQTSIETITIPNRVTHSGSTGLDGALADCSSLTKVVFEDGITEIPNYIMASADHTSYIKEVIIPNSVTSIGGYAFYKCSSLIDIDIPNSVTSIGLGAFYNCTALTNVNIPNSVTSISYDAFRGCKNLKSVIFNENTTNGFKMSIGERAFYGCTSLTSLELPHQVTSLGYEMIGQTSIETITIPNRVTHSGSTGLDGALADCSSLTKVVFEDGITEIPNYIMASADHTSYIKEVIIPNSVTNIGNYAFYKCNNLTIICPSGSYAETYAKENNIPYVIIGAGTVGSDGSKLSLPSTKTYTVGTQTTIADCLVATLTPHVNDWSDIVWTSSNTDVVEIINPRTGINGITADSLWCDVNCKAVGASVITVTNSKGASASCLVTVTDKETTKDNNYGITQNRTSNKTKEEQLISAVDEYETALSVYESNLVDSLGKVQVPEVSSDSIYNSMKPTIAGMVTVPKDAQEACYRAIYNTIANMSYSETALDKINMGADQITVSTSVIKQIANAYVNIEKEYPYEEYDITVRINGFNGANFGTLTYTPKKKHLMPITVGFTTNEQEMARIMADYLNQVKVMEENALDEALISTIDFFNEQVGLDKYIKSKFTKVIDKYAPALNNLGLGEVVSFIDDCKTVCTHVDKISKLDTNDLSSVYDEISSLSKLEVGNVNKVSNTVVKKAYSNLVTCRNNMITAARNYIYNTPEPETFWDKITSWKCPVDIIVYDSKGNEIGSIIGDEITCNSNDIMLKKTGDLKQVYTSNGVEVSFKIVATDYGLLNVTVEDYSNNAVVGRQNFYNIPLDINEELTTSSISNKIDNMIIYTPSGEVINDEYISSSADAVVNISLLSSENGSVQGIGEYAKGDAVKLKAVPNDGYRFIGWYGSEDELLSENIIYNFTAYQDTELKALFAECVDVSDDTDKYIYGDADADGTLTASDAATVLQKVLDNAYAMGIEAKAADYMPWVDVDSDGNLMASDAAMILQKVLDSTFELPCEKQ